MIDSAPGERVRPLRPYASGATGSPPAEFPGATDSVRPREERRFAELVLLEANPLEDITNPHRIAAVVSHGRYFDRDAPDELLADVQRAARLSAGPAEPDTVRYTMVPHGIPSGERLAWTDPPHVWRSRLEVGLRARHARRAGKPCCETEPAEARW